MHDPSLGAEGQGQAAARAFLERVPGPASPAVLYRSAGRVLLLGAPALCVPAAAELVRRGLSCAVLAPAIDGVDPETGATSGGIPVLAGSIESFQGYLGAFQVAVGTGGEIRNLAEILGIPAFDVVVDAGAVPRLEWPIPPPGYLACGPDAEHLAAVVEAAAELVGEFEKPRFFAYDPALCAHGAGGIVGCTRCLDACPTHAITSLEDRIQVDPYLCQGGGICSTVCPTGAIRYAYPPPDGLLETVRQVLVHYRKGGGSQATLVFHDRVVTGTVDETLPALPEHVVPVAVEKVASVGLEVWLAALVYGARQVVLAAIPGMPGAVRAALEARVALADTLLASLGYRTGRVAMPMLEEAGGLAGAIEFLPVQDHPPPVDFMAVADKRETLRRALAHLYAHGPRQPVVSDLPAGAPFGTLRVDPQACILCMACVRACPVEALGAAADSSKLLFLEGNCVQCGLCVGTCPERAVTLVPRLAWDPAMRDTPRVLHEEEPFRCIRCGVPFTTPSMLRRMAERLEGNWVLAEADSARRLRMCPRCRMQDVHGASVAGHGGGE